MSGNYICPKTSWKCNSGECISKSGRCDAVDDCDDESDEKECSKSVIYRCN